MNKLKRFILFGFALLLFSAAAVTGTLAYETLSAQEWAEQTDQTLEVVLVQQQRSYDAAGNLTGLEPYESHGTLVPLPQSAQYDGTNFDRYGMPTAEGYVDQIIRVANTGTADAWARIIVAVPAVLDDSNDAGQNALHWNLGNRFMPDGTFSSDNALNSAFEDISWEYTETAAVGGISCNLYTFTYEKPLAAGSTADAAAFVGFYLDKDVNVVNGRLFLGDRDTGFYNDEVSVFVAAQAVQAYGFESAEAAFRSADLKSNPWL